MVCLIPGGLVKRPSTSVRIIIRSALISADRRADRESLSLMLITYNTNNYKPHQISTFPYFTCSSHFNISMNVHSAIWRILPSCPRPKQVGIPTHVQADKDIIIYSTKRIIVDSLFEDFCWKISSSRTILGELQKIKSNDEKIEYCLPFWGRLNADQWSLHKIKNADNHWVQEAYLDTQGSSPYNDWAYRRYMQKMW